MSSIADRQELGRKVSVSGMSEIGPLKRPLPAGRTLEELWNHFQVEKALAASLKRADHAERRAIYETMYDELLRRVPDHPRLTRKEPPPSIALVHESRLSLIGNLLQPDTIVLEFGPGDCSFAATLAPRVRYVYGIDISDQRAPGAPSPDNFALVVYDGYDTNAIAADSVDLVFSDQLIEHFHPEDTEQHLQLAHRLLKKGGRYVLRTPHRLSGPHDISAFFSDEPLGFHLKEWTYREMAGLLQAAGYSRWHGCWCAKGRKVDLPFAYFVFWERLLGALPKARARTIAARLMREIVVVAQK